MPRKMTLNQRVHASFILAMAFLLVLASNRLNQRNFSTVEHTVNSVFEDRVVAQEYIYRLNNLFHEKEMHLASTEWNYNDFSTSTGIKKLLADFAMTKLTNEESIQFNNLKENYAQLQTWELAYATNRSTIEMESKKEMGSLLQKISGNLDRLSEVQLSEGRQLTQLSTKSLSMNQLLSRLEVGFLIIIGLLILVIIFHKQEPNMMLVEDKS